MSWLRAISYNFYILAYDCTVRAEQLYTVHIAKHHYHVTTQNITNTGEEKEKHKSVYANFLQINAKPLIQK
jgi:hypothetical protein